MAPGLLEEFTTAAAAAGAGVTRTPAAEADAAVEAAVAGPAVGAPLAIDGVSLPAEVTTDASPAQLTAATTGVTGATAGIAANGAVVVASTAAGEAPASLFPERHVAVLAAGDLVADVAAAIEPLEALASDGRDAVVVTGPSATADMGELVIGAHGPSEVEVVVVTDR